MAYRIEHNIVIRDGATVAVVQLDGSLEVPEGMEKYRTQAVKELAKAGRRRDDGTFVFDAGDVTMPMDGRQIETPPEPPPVERRAISTVRELVSKIEAATGEKAPALSTLYGDETPEVWAYLRRHVGAYNALKQSFDIKIEHNHIEE